MLSGIPSGWGIQVALNTIATGIAILSGQTLPETKALTGTARKPMSAEAGQRIAEGLRRSAQAKAPAKAAQGAAPAPQAPAPAPVEAPVAVSAPETHAEAPADAQVLVSPVNREHPGKRRKHNDASVGQGLWNNGGSRRFRGSPG
jgi:hypothetical protein